VGEVASAPVDYSGEARRYRGYGLGTFVSFHIGCAIYQDSVVLANILKCRGGSYR